MRSIRSEVLLVWRVICRLAGRQPAERRKIPHTIVFNSPELACLHEAGHAETALSVGARVVEVELYREIPRSYGRTRVERDNTQRRHIALGGFAVEYLLFRANRLVKQDGRPPTEKEFVDSAIDNASEDRVGYFGQDLVGTNGRWPKKLDEEFVKYSIDRAENSMNFGLVERIAVALLAAGKLDEDSIRRIADQDDPSIEEPRSIR